MAHAAGALELSTPAFKQGEKIPSKYTCDGAGMNPALNFGGVPANTKQFVLTMNRFAWETAAGKRSNDERRQSVLSFARVLGVKVNGIDPKRKSDVLSLLAIRFLPSEAPAGAVELDFAGNATVRLEVECIEARLTDMGGAWRASSRPAHEV